jgi:DNA-binding transcriptional regulator YdaS (Cro superfamily)
MPREKALRDAIDRAGGIRALARELQIAHQAISKWERVPAVRVLEIERITGVSRYQLRPDVYGPDPKHQK